MTPEIERLSKFKSGDSDKNRPSVFKEFSTNQISKPKKQVPPFAKFQKGYSQEVSILFGFIYLTFALIGFVVPDFLNTHLSYSLNVLHFISGLMAIFFGSKSSSAAKTSSLLIGLFYLFLGLGGVFMGVRGTAFISNLNEDPLIWRVVPRLLELGKADHSIHLISGLILIMGSVLVFNIHSHDPD